MRRRYNPDMDWIWNRVETGCGKILLDGAVFELALPSATDRRYSNAQIDDTRGRARRRYRWRPPLRLSLWARFSHSAGGLLGTAGFGFWNVPLGPALLPALPRAGWFFFGSPPHNVPLAYGVPGWGWKAACLDAARSAAAPWAILAPFAVLAMQSDRLYRLLWPRIQRALGISEALIPADLREWHHYSLSWRELGTHFWVDDRLVLEAPIGPRGPLGFVAWIDNQYAVATPRGRFGWGLLNVADRQWMQIKDLEIQQLSQ